MTKVSLSDLIAWDDYYNLLPVANISPPKNDIPMEIKVKLAQNAKKNVEKLAKRFGRKAKRRLAKCSLPKKI